MKMSKKILSVILAVLMAFSTFAVTLSASAAEEPVKPEYTENVTEEDIATLFEDVDTLLLNNFLKGSVIESIFKAFTNTLSGTLMNYARDVEFYTDGIWSRQTKLSKDPQTQQFVREYIFELKDANKTTPLNAERFADLATYGDGNTVDQVAAADKDLYPEDMPGRYKKGNLTVDVPAKEEIKDPDTGEITQEAADAIPGSFTKFFAEHPIEVNSLEDFKNEINNVVATFMMGGLGLVNALGSAYRYDPGFPPYIPPSESGGAPQALYDIFVGLDDVCEGLGIEQPKKAAECFVGWNYNNTAVNLFPTTVQALDENGEPTIMDENYPNRHAMVPYEGYYAEGNTAQQDATVYIQNIVNALFDGGLVKNVVGVLQNFVSEEGGAKVYKGVALILDALQRACDCPFGANLGAHKTTDAEGNTVTEYTGIAGTLHNVYETFKTLPTVGEGDAKRLDFEGIIGFLINDVLHMGSTIQIVFDQTLFDESFDNARHKKPLGQANIELIFKPMADDLAKVAAAESPADAAKFVVDYLYETALLNKYNNAKLYNIFSDNLLNLDDEIVNFAMDVIDPDDDVKNVPKPLDDLLPMAFSAVAEMVDHHLNLEKHEAKEVTCTEDGYSTTCYYCPDCGLYFAESEDVEHTPKSEAIPEEEVANYAVKATGHEFGDVVAAKEATLYDDGNVAYKHCEKCDKNFAADADIMAADDTAIENVTIPKREGKLGDINDNGDVDLVDILMAKKYVADLEEFDDVQLKLADVNADGVVDLVDVLAIMKYQAGIITDFSGIPA